MDDMCHNGLLTYEAMSRQHPLSQLRMLLLLQYHIQLFMNELAPFQDGETLTVLNEILLQKSLKKAN
jgi:hypothetical protein